MAHLRRKHWAGPSALRAQRLAAGLTLSALAEKAGVSERTLARAEAGEVSSGTALRIAEGLNVPFSWVFPDHSDADAVRSACAGHEELEAA